MANVKRVASNSTSLFLGTILTRLVDLIVVIIIARLFPKEDMGIYTMVLITVTVVSYFVSIGGEVILIRDCAIDKENTQREGKYFKLLDLAE